MELSYKKPPPPPFSPSSSSTSSASPAAAAAHFGRPFGKMWPNRMISKDEVYAGKRFRRTTSMSLISSYSDTVEAADESADAATTNECTGRNGIKVASGSAEADSQRLPPADGKQDPGNFKVVKAQEMLGLQSKLLWRPGGEHPLSVIRPVDFLNFCFYCKKRLRHERDIFIYRGDTAFCSEECRDRQITKDERTVKGGRKSATIETAVAA